MPQAWRIVPRNRAEAAFDGEGARLFGGRWNSPGRAAVYLAGSRALAALEMLVHLNSTAAQKIPYARFQVEIPDKFIEEWERSSTALKDILGPSINPISQVAGDEWLQEGIKPVLRIPSAVIPEEPNYLLNPRHPSFPSLKISEPEPFAFDPRLVSL